METMEAIHTRQSIGKVKSDPVPRRLIEELLSAAVQAPNHYKVRPWRFVVLTGAARERLGEVMAASLREKHPDYPSEAFQKEREKPLRSPVLIAVGVDKPSEAKVIELENICAAAAAVENLLLAAHDQGLAAKWRTGGPAMDPKVKEFLGFPPDQPLIGFIYIGYPEFEPAPAGRPSYEDRTIWMD
jgi:nitroreductase